MWGGHGWGGFVLLDRTTGLKLAPTCGNAYFSATVTYPQAGPGLEPDSYWWQLRTDLKEPVWSCNWTVAADRVDPSHEFVVSVNNDVPNNCASVVECGNPMYASTVEALTSGAEWLNSGGYWRGGPDPATPPRTVDPATIPAYGSSVASVWSWWYFLNTVQRDNVARAYPERIGELDGVSVAQRDVANRIVLGRERPRLAARIAQLDAELQRIQQMREQGRLLELYPQAMSLAEAGIPADADVLLKQAEYGVAGKQIACIDVVQQRLDNQAVPAYLISFSTSRGNGRVVLSVNNPDTAENVITYVPGTFLFFDAGLAGDIERSDKMAADAAAIAAGKSSASITWFGYDAPQSLPSAGREVYAVDAAPDLRRFQAGLDSTHKGARHFTLIGHSYGTTVIGYTARATAGVRTDDMILVASPGVGVDKASELHGVADGHVWAGTYGWDIIRGVPDFWFGNNPVDLAFGARQFGLEWDTDQNHTTYWDGTYASNAVRQSIAAISTGLYGSVR